MSKNLIKIDETKCNGCGLCVDACHEGAIGLVDGKARLLRSDYCDGLGACLPVCPTQAITFEDSDAEAFDGASATPGAAEPQPDALPCGCPSQNTQSFSPRQESETPTTAPTHLNQWPIQIKLVPQNAPYLNGANLLIAADCAAYAYGNFHSEYMKNRITLIGCPKLDDIDYAEKLGAILKHNDVKSVSVARMEVPCCGGIVQAVKSALSSSGKLIPWQIVTISTDGRIVEN